MRRLDPWGHPTEGQRGLGIIPALALMGSSSLVVAGLWAAFSGRWMLAGLFAALAIIAAYLAIGVWTLLEARRLQRQARMGEELAEEILEYLEELDR